MRARELTSAKMVEASESVGRFGARLQPVAGRQADRQRAAATATAAVTAGTREPARGICGRAS